MANPKNFKTLGACVPMEIYDAVNARAAREGVSVNALLKQAICAALSIGRLGE